jgi:hypothetical protein
MRVAMSRRRWVLTGLLVVGMALVAAVLVLREIGRHRVAPTDVGPMPFDARGWASGSATKRHGMAIHLVESRGLVGRPKDDIINQLGPPLSDHREGRLEWYLGQRKSGASMMWNYQGYLAVTLNNRGECQEAYIYNLD